MRNAGLGRYSLRKMTRRSCGKKNDSERKNNQRKIHRCRNPRHRHLTSRVQSQHEAVTDYRYSHHSCVPGPRNSCSSWNNRVGCSSKNSPQGRQAPAHDAVSGSADQPRSVALSATVEGLPRDELRGTAAGKFVFWINLYDCWRTTKIWCGGAPAGLTDEKSFGAPYGGPRKSNMCSVAWPRGRTPVRTNRCSPDAGGVSMPHGVTLTARWSPVPCTHACRLP